MSVLNEYNKISMRHNDIIPRYIFGDMDEPQLSQTLKARAYAVKWLSFQELAICPIGMEAFYVYIMDSEEPCIIGKEHDSYDLAVIAAIEFV